MPPKKTQAGWKDGSVSSSQGKPSVDQNGEASTEGNKSSSKSSANKSKPDTTAKSSAKKISTVTQEINTYGSNGQARIRSRVPPPRPSFRAPSTGDAKPPIPKKSSAADKKSSKKAPSASAQKAKKSTETTERDSERRIKVVNSLRQQEAGKEAIKKPAGKPAPRAAVAKAKSTTATTNHTDKTSGKTKHREKIAKSIKKQEESAASTRASGGSSGQKNSKGPQNGLSPSFATAPSLAETTSSVEGDRRLKEDLQREQQEKASYLFNDAHSNDRRKRDPLVSTTGLQPQSRQSEIDDVSQPGAYHRIPGLPGFIRNPTFRRAALSRDSSLQNSNDHGSPRGDQVPHPPSSLSDDISNGRQDDREPMQRRPANEDAINNLLVRALPVMDDSYKNQEITLAHPEEAASYRSPEEEKRSRTLFYIRSAAGVGMVLFVALVIGLIVRSQKKNNSPTIIELTRAPSQAPTGVPTVAPTPFVVGYLPGYTKAAILQDPKSPQGRAYHWLLGDPNMTDYDEFRTVQRFALATLYYAMEGEKWKYSMKWLNYSDHECTWFPSEMFPSCTLEGAYRKLQLRNTSLQGTLPEELGLLTSLTTLDLRNNLVQATLPSTIGLLSNLRELLVGNNALVGSLPTEIGLLVNLRHLSIPDNDFQAALPSEIGALYSLNEWNMQRSNVTGTLPTDLGNLKSLQIWDAWANPTIKDNPNHITGCIPSEFGKLKNLTSLGLYNHIELNCTIPTELGNLISLEHLQVDYGALHGPIPSELSLLPSIQFLSLGGNFLTSTLPTELSRLSTLRTLRLFQNMLTGPVPTEIGQATSLNTIELDDNKLSKTIPTQFGQLVSMQRLVLGSNQFVGPLPSEIGRLRDLKEFSLTNCPLLNGSIPVDWENLVAANGLEELYLGGTDITGTIPFGICTVQQLQIDCDADICNCDCGICTRS